jgi:hypothetical protein
MNLASEVVRWNKRLTPIPEPYYVVRCDDHFMVCTLDRLGNLIEEVSVIHWSPWVVRRWAFEFSVNHKPSTAEIL